MKPSPFDCCLLLPVAVFAAWGFFSGARAQLKMLFALAFAFMAALPLTPVLTPLAASAWGVSPGSLKLKLALFCGSFFILLCGGVFLVEKLGLSGPAHGEKVPPWDRAAGLLVGAAKSSFGVYALLSALILLERPLTMALGRTPEVMVGSQAVDYVRANALFGTSASPELQKVTEVIQDPLEADRKLQEEMKKTLTELTASPAPSAQNVALANAIKTGDMAVLSKDPRFAALIKTTGANALLKPAEIPDPAKAGVEPAAAPKAPVKAAEDTAKP